MSMGAATPGGAGAGAAGAAQRVLSDVGEPRSPSRGDP